MIDPSNNEFFRFLADDLAFSHFRRSGDALISFKETIEFVLLPEATPEGPQEGLLFEGTTSMSAERWREFVASFALSAVETEIDRESGQARRVFHATKQVGAPAELALSAPAEGSLASPPAGASPPVQEELYAESAHYVWAGSSRQPDSPGQLTVHARRIACRGADKGLPAALIFRDKLRQFQQRDTGAAASAFRSPEPWRRPR